MEQPTVHGHYRQVVLIQRCGSNTEVAHGAAYSAWSLETGGPHAYRGVV